MFSIFSTVNMLPPIWRQAGIEDGITVHILDPPPHFFFLFSPPPWDRKKK